MVCFQGRQPYQGYDDALANFLRIEVEWFVKKKVTSQNK